MSDKELFKLFLLFLEIKGALSSWKYYQKNDWEYTLRGLKSKPSEKWVIGAFSWSDTRQGHDYWDNLHEEWLSSLEKIEKNTGD